MLIINTTYNIITKLYIVYIYYSEVTSRGLYSFCMHRNVNTLKETCAVSNMAEISEKTQSFVHLEEINCFCISQVWPSVQLSKSRCLVWNSKKRQSQVLSLRGIWVSERTFSRDQLRNVFTSNHTHSSKVISSNDVMVKYRQEQYCSIFIHLCLFSWSV